MNPFLNWSDLLAQNTWELSIWWQTFARGLDSFLDGLNPLQIRFKGRHRMLQNGVFVPALVLQQLLRNTTLRRLFVLNPKLVCCYKTAVALRCYNVALLFLVNLLNYRGIQNCPYPQRIVQRPQSRRSRGIKLLQGTNNTKRVGLSPKTQKLRYCHCLGLTNYPKSFPKNQWWTLL